MDQGEPYTNDPIVKAVQEARTLADLARILGKPIVVTETNDENPGEARVTIAVVDEIASCNELLEHLRDMYPDASIELIGGGKEGDHG